MDTNVLTALFPSFSLPIGVLTTLEESKQLFETANQPKELRIVPTAEHVDLQKFTPIDYEQKVLGFFQKTLRGASK